MKDFFISYNSADKAWAEWIAWQLKEAGYSVRLDVWHFRPGSNFVLEMQKATSESRQTIAVLSQDFLQASFTQPEWAAAFREDPEGSASKLIPVRIDKCKPKGMLGSIIYIDLSDKTDEEAARKALLEGVKSSPAEPVSAVPFPKSKAKPIGVAPAFPGFPKIWNVPLARNRNFTGREVQLKRLHDSLASGKVAALTQAIRGLGGVGKTQIAAEYAYRHAGEYDVVWWVQSEDATKRASDYANLAMKLGLKEAEDKDLNVTIDAVREWLRMHDKWLLIFDNAEHPDDIRPYLPHSTLGHVLITSRYSAWEAIAEPLDIEIMPEPEAIEFLLKRTGSDDRTTAAEIAKELGYLPLALEQAGAYIERTRIRLAEYLKAYRKSQTKLFKEAASTPATGYEHTILTTWTMALEEVQGQCPAAIELMNLCAFLAPDDIPKDMLIADVKHLPRKLARVVKNELKFNNAIAALRNFSLVNMRDDGLSVHRLLQAVIREQLKGVEQKTWAGAAVEITNKIFPYDSDDVRTWRICARLLPHAHLAASQAEERDVAHEATGRLLNQAGLYLEGRAQFAEAKALLERALKIYERTDGPDHPNVATIVNNLGSVLQDMGDLAEAKRCYERALKIDEKAYGPDHPNVIRDVNSLGLVLKEQGELTGAKACHERALRTNEKAYGPDHPRVAADVNNLGLVLLDMRDLAGAKKCFERALKIDEKVFGPGHPTVATDVNNLGSALRDLGDLAGAKKCFERALKIDEKVFGPDHPTVARDVNNLGGVLQDLGDLAGAKKCFERAYQIWVRFLGEEHPYTKIARENLDSLPPE